METVFRSCSFVTFVSVLSFLTELVCAIYRPIDETTGVCTSDSKAVEVVLLIAVEPGDNKLFVSCMQAEF